LGLYYFDGPSGSNEIDIEVAAWDEKVPKPYNIHYTTYPGHLNGTKRNLKASDSILQALKLPTGIRGHQAKSSLEVNMGFMIHRPPKGSSPMRHQEHLLKTCQKHPYEFT
jgi:hypothetical protein